MRIADLVLTQTAAAVLVDEVLARESMVDGASAPQRARTERHAGRLAIEYPPS
jgi:hypothetical protein